ncbi:MAG: outer membrane beta-barrel protein [Flavobacteriales bacterium]
MRSTITALLFSTIAGISLNTSRAQAQAFTEGSNNIYLGYGAVTLMGSISRNFDTYTDVDYSSLGPIYVKYEHGVTENIGLGISFAYATNQWVYKYTANEQTYTETTDRSTYSILARFNYHIGDSEKFDPYIGFGVGYRDATWTSESDGTTSSGVELKSLFPFGMDLTFGTRYFFTDNIGLYAEVGAAKSVVQGGLAVKF